MTRRDLLFGAVTACLATAAQGKRPNVILVITDDQGFGDLSLHGNPDLSTPNLDRVGTEGIRFDQFHVNPVCSPTRSSLMTGRYYYRTGVVDTYLGRSMMWNDEVTLAEVLRGAGYRTGLFGKWHLGDHRPLRPQDQGFEETLSHHGGGIGQPSDPPGGDHYFDATLYRNGEKFKSKGYCTDVFFDGAMDFATKHRDKPFFAYIATNAPHDPLEVDPRYTVGFEKFDAATAKTYGMIRNLDENMGRLIAKLEELKIERDTILIFMTDNGPQRKRYNAGMRGIKGTVYEGGIRVPFFVRWPAKIAAGGVDRHLAAHIDILPTLAEACGAKLPAKVKLDGRSLMPLINGAQIRQEKNWHDRTLFFQWHRGDRGRLFDSCAARNQRYKLVNGVELYDLETDPAESKDIASANPAIVAKMRGEYETWFRDVSATRDFAPPKIYLGDPLEPAVLLTRQDWRGEKASWNADGLGHWEVDVRAAGRYEARLLFAPAKGLSTARASLGGSTASVAVAAGASEATVQFATVRKGLSRLEAHLETKLEPMSDSGTAVRGMQYVEVRKL